MRQRLKNGTCTRAGVKGGNEKGNNCNGCERSQWATQLGESQDDPFLRQASEWVQGQGMMVKGKQLRKHHLLEASSSKKINRVLITSSCALHTIIFNRVSSLRLSIDEVMRHPRCL